MRRAMTAFLFWLAAAAAPAHALGDLTAFPLLQKECMEIGGIRFGPGERYADCRVTKGEWVAIMDIVELYQAQYCLGSGGDGCARVAQLIFVNRPYTPVGRLLVVRSDPGGTSYDDPLFFISEEHGTHMMLVRRAPDGASTRSYYRWENERLIPVAEQEWMRSPEYRIAAGDSDGVPFYASERP